jgi:hypothetical protein
METIKQNEKIEKMTALIKETGKIIDEIYTTKRVPYYKVYALATAFEEFVSNPERVKDITQLKLFSFIRIRHPPSGGEKVVKDVA